MERIRRLDVFREVPRDLTEPTVAGAAATVVAAVVAMMLLISEVSAFMAVKTESRTFVDVANDAHGVGESLDVRINLTFPRLPCIRKLNLYVASFESFWS